jgi:O-antigen/teichoic acid export membrane protein
MFKKILGTTGTRFFTAVITFLIVIINARALGKEGVGEIALIVIGITIVIMISNFVGGGALVFLAPRHRGFLLLFPSYLWALVAAAGGSLFLKAFDLIPVSYTNHVFFISLLQAVGLANLNYLLGKEKIKEYNLILFVQFLILMGSVLIFFYFLDRKEVVFYVYALYLAFGSTFLLSFLTVKPLIDSFSFEGLSKTLKQILVYGFFVQMGNLIQMLNYRLGYYIIEHYLGKARLGIFDIGNKISEGVWLFGKSISMVQYSTIANTEDSKQSSELTIQLAKMVFIVTSSMVLILLLLPETFFTFIFGSSFYDIKLVIKTLSVGIISLSSGMIVSHFFAGKGLYHINTISASVGLFFTVVLGFTLIPKMGLIGAGITASISYTASVVYQWFVFIRMTDTPLKRFLLTKEDFLLIKREIRKLIKPHSL